MELKKILRPLTIGGILLALAFLAYRQGLVEVVELKSLDWRFKIRGARPPQSPIVLVSVDEDSFDELDLPWPWPRTLHAELIHKLAQGHPKLIALDILFTEPRPDRREDRALAEAVKEAGNVILAGEYIEVPTAFGPKMGMSLPIPLIREHAIGYGPVNLIRDPDGIVRQGQLALSFQDRIHPSFAYQIYRGLAGQEGPDLRKVSAIPYVINFRGPARSYPVVPYYRILRGEVEPFFFRDKVVLVGAFAPSLHDIFPTPFSASQPMAGVEIQANLVETLLANDPIVLLSSWASTAIFFLLLALTIWIALSLKPLKGFALVLALSALYVFFTLYLFSKLDLWVPVVPGLLGIALTYSGINLDSYIREQKERVRLHATFSKYVSPDIVDEILEDREGLGLGGRRRHVTVLFSDIRGFTQISEQIAPELVVSLLSDYLAQVTYIIFKHGGTVDKFIGDAVMAIFGAPKSHGDDALRAVKTGLEMIELAKSLGPKWTQATGNSLKIGVGINSGEAVVGSIGSEIRSDFTAIGDTVNLASRLEGLTKELGVPMLVSEFTAAELKDSISLRPLRQIKVIGRETPLLVYYPDGLLEGEVEFELAPASPYVQQYK